MARLLLMLGIGSSGLCKELARCHWVVPEFATSCPGSPYAPGSWERGERRGGGTFGGGRRHLRYGCRLMEVQPRSERQRWSITNCSNRATIGTIGISRVTRSRLPLDSLTMVLLGLEPFNKR